MCRVLAIPLLCLLAAACADAGDKTAQDAALIARDPVMARALHDPLLTDPDLASRNEANAVIGFVDSDALPVFTATSQAAQAAREVLRLELLEGGPIPALPPALAQEAGTRLLGPMAGPAELLAAVGAPAACAEGLREDFALAASLPPAAAIPSPAMVSQAAGAETAGCRLRILRYATAAPRDDVLQYHYTRAQRAALKPEYRGEMIAAKGAGAERLAVHVRAAPNGLTGVTLVYRAP